MLNRSHWGRCGSAVVGLRSAPSMKRTPNGATRALFAAALALRSKDKRSVRSLQPSSASPPCTSRACVGLAFGH